MASRKKKRGIKRTSPSKYREKQRWNRDGEKQWKYFHRSRERERENRLNYRGFSTKDLVAVVTGPRTRTEVDKENWFDLVQWRGRNCEVRWTSGYPSHFHHPFRSPSICYFSQSSSASLRRRKQRISRKFRTCRIRGCYLCVERDYSFFLVLLLLLISSSLL